MRKTFLIRANVLLSTLILLLAGCHTTKKAAASQSETPAKQDEATVPSDRVVCMYGVPAQVYEQQRQDSLKKDSASTARPDRIMLKYGIPSPLPDMY